MTISEKKAGLPDTITTDRLLLRTPELGDASALQFLANNKSIFRVLARLPHPYTIEHALDFINNLARSKDEHAYAIINENEDFIGVIGLNFGGGNAPELGYWLGEPYWGKGYATEAAIAVIAVAAKIGINKISARSITENGGSIKVLKKAGFQETSSGIDDCGHHRNVNVTRLQWQKLWE